ncbi:hypothetical protein TNCV_4214001 [Trichonephila clavipes]|nr:hypothetical protein TNCV_4214001 [Trichonephila clavipes]
MMSSDQPTNKNTLIRALTEEWDKLSQQLLDNVVQSSRLPCTVLMPHSLRNTGVLSMRTRGVQFMILGTGLVWRCLKQQFSSFSPGVSKFEFDHHDVAGRSGIRQ